MFAVTCAIPCAVQAEDFPFPPDHKVICDPNPWEVNKEKLATYLLKRYPVSSFAVREGAMEHGNFADAELLAKVLTKDSCKDKCGPTDDDALGDMRSEMIVLLRGDFSAYFDPNQAARRSASLPELYFRSDSLQIACTGVDPVREEKPKSSDGYNFRLRGDPNQLNIDRTDKDAFGETEKATISILRDQAGGSRTSSVLAYIGFPITALHTDQNGRVLDVIPYFGINRNAVNPLTGSNTATDYSDSNAYGALIWKFRPPSDSTKRHPYGDSLNIRPEYLVDHAAGSRLLSLNLVYTPIFASLLNERLPYRSGRYLVTPVVSVRTNFGRYADRGKPTAIDNNKDFTRIGGQIGWTGTSNHPSVPVDFSILYTKLRARSDAKDVSFMKSTINWNLHPKKYVGIAFSTSHGYREDTAKLEHKREIALTMRY